VRENPGQITLLCIGPLTNIAMALVKAPDITRKVEKVVIMGGVLRGRNLLTTRYAEHNIVCDPEAAHIVFNAGWPIVLVPLDVTEQVRIAKDDARRLYALNTPFHTGLAKELDGFFLALAKHGSPKDDTFMHDPLTVASLIDPSLVRLSDVHLDVELGGTFATAATLMRAPSAEFPANVAVALDVDSVRFEALLRARIVGDRLS
jgi:purine nucleosidase